MRPPICLKAHQRDQADQNADDTWDGEGNLTLEFLLTKIRVYRSTCFTEMHSEADGYTTTRKTILQLKLN